MPWYHKESRRLQSIDPGEGCFGELLADRREGWEEVDNGFTPPMTLKEKCARVDVIYTEKLRLLEAAVSKLTSRGKPVGNIPTQYVATEQEWKAKLQEIIAANG